MNQPNRATRQVYVKVVEDIAEYMEGEGCSVQHGTLEEVIVEYLNDEINGGRYSINYLHHRYGVTKAHAFRILSILKQLPYTQGEKS